MSKKTKSNEANEYRYKYITISGYSDESEISSHALVFMSIPVRGGKIKNISISQSITTDKTLLKKQLTKYGFYPKKDATKKLGDTAYWTGLSTFLSQPIKREIELVGRPGFHGKIFVRADDDINVAITNSSPLLSPVLKISSPIIYNGTTLKEWQDNVADAGRYSSRFLLAQCCAFSGPLARWAGIESGGFHIFGDSSTGKSTCAYGAVSVYGPRPSLRSWYTTEAAIEDTAIAFCDNLLCLDEIKLLDSDPVKAAQKASLIIYQLASGTIKSRHPKSQYSSLQDAQQWKTGLFSTGECSLRENAKNAAAEYFLGEQVRVVDVPADAGCGIGIFETLPKLMKGDPGKYAELIDSNTKIYYGIAHKIFLKNLIKALQKDENRVRRNIGKRMDYFLDKNNVNRKIGHQTRLAKRFALAYAAGISACKSGVLPFDEKLIFKGISKCYQDTIEYQHQFNPLSKKEQADAAYSKILKLVDTSEFLDIRNNSKKISDKKIDKAKGFIYTLNKTKVAAIPLDRIQKILGNGNVRKKVLERLKTENLLLPRTDGKISRQINVRHSNEDKPHLVCFKLD
jgi:putative DNA primase/helicase